MAKDVMARREQAILERDELALEIIRTMHEWWKEGPAAPIYPSGLLFGGKYGDKTIKELVAKVIENS